MYLGLLQSLIYEFKGRFKDNLVAIYGVGSYFDDSVPFDWEKNDINLIVFLHSIEALPKRDFTEVRYEKLEVEGKEIWMTFLPLKAIADKELFRQQSFSNYEWSILEFSSPENSVLLFGPSLTPLLPSLKDLEVNFDDILARGFYHLDKSLGTKEDLEIFKRFFSKAVFKLGFYACLYFDRTFQKTSIRVITQKISELTEQDKIPPFLNETLKECILYRRGKVFQTAFSTLRQNFTLNLFSSLSKGIFHRQMKYKTLKQYLAHSFAGFPNLIGLLQELKNERIKKNRHLLSFPLM